MRRASGRWWTRGILRVPVVLGLVGVFPGTALAEDGVSVEIGRKARLAATGQVVFLARISCGPLPGTPDFTEGLAGAAHPKTGAEGEGGLSPDVVCDGTVRVYTAAISSFTDEVFRRGPAFVSATVTACSTVGDDQVCVSGSDSRRVVVVGRLLGASSGP